MAMVTTSLRPEPLISYGRTWSFSAMPLLTHFSARGSIFTSARRTRCMLRCLVSAVTTSSSLQKPFCTRMAPSLPPHCFWWPSALWSWCSSMTPDSVSTCPSRLRGGIVPSLPLDPGEVLVAREHALLDQQLDHRLQRDDRPSLGVFHGAQDFHRALAGTRRGGSGFGRCLGRLGIDAHFLRLPGVVDDVHPRLLAVVAEHFLPAIPARDGVADGARSREQGLDLLPAGQRDQVVGGADVERVAHRHHHRAALVLERDRHQAELLGSVGRDDPERALVTLPAEVRPGDAGLLRERADQHLF